jgi:hypothetical protein
MAIDQSYSQTKVLETRISPLKWLWKQKKNKCKKKRFWNTGTEGVIRFVLSYPSDI